MTYTDGTGASGIPRDGNADDALALLHDGYAYGTRRFRRLGSDAFRTRLLGRPTIVMRGREASAVFGDHRRMSRAGAIPRSVMHLLQDEGSVQSLEGEAHHHRKAVFLHLLDDEGAARLADASGREWEAAARRASGRTESLYDIAVEVLTRSAVDWIGLPPDSTDIDRLGGALAEMVDAAPTLGPRNWSARLRRRRVERWAASLVRDARAGTLRATTGSPLAAMATLHDHDGTQPPPGTAAVELINLLRPIVAVARYVVFAAHALERHPGWRDRVRTDPEARGRFVQEVRRFYPFFPVAAGTVKAPFSWRGHEFEPGSRVLLDLYATDHDPSAWPEPDRFDPDRFLTWLPDPDTLVPQGAGDAASGHRCPGEGATIALIDRFLAFATADPQPYSVPPQDLRISLRRLPALPEDRMLVTVR